MALLLSSCTLLQNNNFISKTNKDNLAHAFVYALPYGAGECHGVVQGYRSVFSHAGDYAIDFKMKPGTKIRAARAGQVIYVMDKYIKGGVGKRFVGKGNGITIKHSDSTYAHYWHLQYKGALIKLGDSVKQGEVIGLSGSTGFSAFPHLHFEVTRKPSISDKDIPVLFQTKKGIKFLQPLRWYKGL